MHLPLTLVCRESLIPPPIFSILRLPVWSSTPFCLYFWPNSVNLPKSAMSYDFFFVTLQEFAGFLCIKAMQRIEKIQGYDLETVLNSTFCYKLLQ